MSLHLANELHISSEGTTDSQREGRSISWKTARPTIVIHKHKCHFRSCQPGKSMPSATSSVHKDHGKIVSGKISQCTHGSTVTKSISLYIAGNYFWKKGYIEGKYCTPPITLPLLERSKYPVDFKEQSDACGKRVILRNFNGLLTCKRRPRKTLNKNHAHVTSEVP